MVVSAQSTIERPSPGITVPLCASLEYPDPELSYRIVLSHLYDWQLHDLVTSVAELKFDACNSSSQLCTCHWNSRGVFSRAAE